MKTKLAIFFLFHAFYNCVFAQTDSTANLKNIDDTQYIFNPRKIKINSLGLYFSPEAGISSLNNKTAPVIAGSFMLLVNKKLAIGFTGQLSGHPNNKKELLRLGYSGAKIEYTIKPSSKVHIGFPLIMAIGSATNDSITREHYSKDFNHSAHNQVKPNNFKHHHNNSQFFIIQPGVNIEANLMKYVIIFGGVSYRQATKTNKLRNINNNDSIAANQISGISATLGFKFGLFNYPILKKDSLARKK
jgi:hypothetical protein